MDRDSGFFRIQLPEVVPDPVGEFVFIADTYQYAHGVVGDAVALLEQFPEQPKPLVEAGFILQRGVILIHEVLGERMEGQDEESFVSAAEAFQALQAGFYMI